MRARRGAFNESPRAIDPVAERRNSGRARARQVQQLAVQSLQLGSDGNSIPMAFFGCYCLALGYLVLDAPFLPRLLGWLLLLTGTIWLIDSIGTLVSPQFGRGIGLYLLPVGAAGELALALWLTIKGVNATSWLATEEA